MPLRFPSSTAAAVLVVGCSVQAASASLLTDISYQRQISALDRFVGASSNVSSSLISGTGTLAPTTVSIVPPNGGFASATCQITDSETVAEFRFDFAYSISFRDAALDSLNQGNPLGTTFRTTDSVDWVLTVSHTAASSPLRPEPFVGTTLRNLSSPAAPLLVDFNNAANPTPPVFYTTGGVLSANSLVLLTSVFSAGVYLPLGGPFQGSMTGEAHFVLTLTRHIPSPAAASTVVVAMALRSRRRRP